MGGGLLQLVAYGAQDAYITGNPHITFWKVLYKRHTNFAMEAFRVNFTGAPQYGQRVVAVINRNADLMYKTYLEVQLPDTFSAADGAGVKWTAAYERRLGYQLLKKIEVEIGGQIIDTHYGEWLFLWESLTSGFDNSVKLDTMLGGYLGGTETTAVSCGGRPAILYIPLQFWFCRNPGLALPLIALQYHDVEIRIYWSSAPGTAIYEAWANFVVLDVVEREDFASRTQNHLIYQVQKATPSGNKTQNLVFNHPIKFIAGSNVVTNVVTTTSDIGNQGMLLQINGVDIGEQKSITPHFNLVPNYYSVPFDNVGTTQFLLPFCLDTSKLQPTGTLNFSRIDSARLVSSANFTDALLGTLYAVNYNILKIENGMGGLLYAN
jgi:hypothetical protein